MPSTIGNSDLATLREVVKRLQHELEAAAGNPELQHTLLLRLSDAILIANEASQREFARLDALSDELANRARRLTEL